MLTQRQFNILEDLNCSTDVFITAKELAQKHGISVRTVQTELARIREFLEPYDSVEYVSIPSKGSRINVMNLDGFCRLIEEWKERTQEENLNVKEVRVNKIISILVNTKESISIQHLADRLFVSRSTLFNDLKTVTEVFESYNIGLLNVPGKGLSVKGNESDIRNCINRENINIFYGYKGIYEYEKVSENISKIRTIVVNILTQFEYRISDIALQNLIVHIDISIPRIHKGFRLEKIEDRNFELEFERELKIAQEIFVQCQKTFNIVIPQEEITRLAIYLRGKSDYVESSYITEETDEFVLSALEDIRDKFGIDLLDNIQLRIALSLHLIPLLTRLRYDMQLKNELLPEIKRYFQVAFDIASSFSIKIQEKFGYRLFEDEISYFAIYFNSALSSSKFTSRSTRLLVVSSMKRSETLLMRERINSRFASEVYSLDILNLFDLPKDLSSYDIVLTTEKNELYEQGHALLISQFPSDNDFRVIRMAIDGYRGKQDILNLFREDMTFIGRSNNKDEVIDILSQFICDFEPSSNLYEEVKMREAMGGTYFGNQIAVPHPLHPITNQTRISVALLENEVEWDAENKARIVFLVSIEKDNPQAFGIWQYLTQFITNSNAVEALLSDLTFENLLIQMSNALDHMTWELQDY